MSGYSGMVERVRGGLTGSYTVLAQDLRLGGIGCAPKAFWVSRQQGDYCLIESSLEDSYWVKGCEVERALAAGWIQRDSE